MKNKLNEDDVSREVRFRATTSSGKGGQHVNKVATRVEVYLDIPGASCFSDEQKTLLLQRLRPKLSHAGVLQVASQAARSQRLNKETALRKLLALVTGALKPVKPRKATRPGRAAAEKRLLKKRRLSEKKEMRRGGGLNAFF